MLSSLKWILPASLLAFATVGCADREAGQQQTDAAVQAFSSEQQAWRDERAARLTKPDGWTSLVGLHWLEPGDHYFGSDTDNGIRLAVGPAHIGMVSRKGDRIRLVPESGVELTLDGQPLKSGADLRSDVEDGGPSEVGFDGGKGLITVIKRGDRYALRVKHADAPSRTGFKGLEYWPGGRDWIVEGTFTAHPAGKTMPIVNIVGTVENMANPGVVEFDRDGRTFRLEALDEGDGQLFLVFADRTSGKGSYPAGRFLYAAPADANGKVLIDFNKSYNPPCAFTAFATCPLPPPENRLDLEITAGEKTYHFEERKAS